MARVYVAGSINLDIIVQVDQQPKVGETIKGTDVEFELGGKGANQAISASRLGSSVELIGKVGQDNFGSDLLSRLQSEDLNIEHVKRASEHPSGMAFVTVDATSDNSIVIVPGCNDEVELNDVDGISMNPSDIAVSQFEIPQRTIRKFFERAQDHGARTILNPAPAATIREPILPLVDYLVVNETEALFYSDSARQLPLSESEIVETCEELRAHPSQVVIVTLGENGVLASTASETISLGPHSVETVDTTGAGDSFVGALATAIRDGKELEPALEFANAAGAIATTSHGASSSLPTRAEVHRIQSGHLETQD